MRDKLVTNQERFVLISKTLDDENLPVADRFAAIDDTVALIDEFRFVGETGLLLETMIGAAQRAARNLLQCGVLEPPFKERVEALAGAPRSRDWYEALEALQILHAFMAADSPELRSPQWILRRLIEVVWGYTFRHYFWLREQREGPTGRLETRLAPQIRHMQQLRRLPLCRFTSAVVAGSGLDVGMAGELLRRRNVRSGIEQVRNERPPKIVR